jgi:hypothetical protein
MKKQFWTIMTILLLGGQVVFAQARQTSDTEATPTELGFTPAAPLQGPGVTQVPNCHCKEDGSPILSVQQEKEEAAYTAQLPGNDNVRVVSPKSAPGADAPTSPRK